MKLSRRYFLYCLGVVGSIIALFGVRAFWKKGSGLHTPQSKSQIMAGNNLGISADGKSHVYIAKNNSPEENIQKAIEMFGGIEKVIDKSDIVVLKPNAQWWNQGTTNTNNMKGFIELILNMPEFKGEIIIAENHHFMKANSRGWTTTERNGDYNLNELVQFFNKRGYKNITKYHWVDGGANPQPQQGDGGNGGVVNSLADGDGDGYVWMKDVVYTSPEERKCMMTYPVFTSSFSGKKIDLHRGSYQNGHYIKNVKFINFSCLNHHSRSFGVTASIKNLMGVSDMTCGFQGVEPKGFYNMHYIGKESLLYQLGTDLKYYCRKFRIDDEIGRLIQKMGYWNTQYTGGALGYWLKFVRMPDLNILAAEYVGWGGRGRDGPYKRKRTNCVALSTDPVALDYIGAKRILFEATPQEEQYYRTINLPDNPPFNSFLRECHAQGIGNLDIEKIKVIESNIKNNTILFS